MNEIDKWAAEQCGVTKYLKNGFISNEFFYNGKWHSFPWEIEDPRCREIVRDCLRLDTDHTGVERICSTYIQNDFIFRRGKTIKEAEIACIEALYKANTE